MSFQRVPSLFRIPEVPGLTPPAAIWRGKGADEGFFAFEAGSAWGGHVIVRDGNFCPSLTVDGMKLAPVFADVNGCLFWRGSGCAYKSKTYGWVYMTGMFPGYEPVEDWTVEDGETTWKGDTFYSFDAPPTGPGMEVSMRPRGAIRESGNAKALKAVWPRWTAKSGEFGVYEAQDGESGERVKGLPQFRGAGETFLRSLNKEDGHFTYGRIHHSNGAWVIGEPGSSAGWHEGSEPKAGGGAVTFRFTKPKGSDAEGSDISVSFEKYVCGDETDLAYLGSAATWR